jgi:tripartite-type tricarboxylate transporter receptor subunit TctC
MHTLTRRLLLAALALGACAGTAIAQDYPSRPIHIIVPFAPGGSTDAVVRILGAQLEKELGATVVVDNRPGGAATIGMNAVAQAAPDGYTLGAANISLGANPSLLKTVPYDVRKDFTPVGLVARVPLVLAVHPSVAAKSVTEFIALAKEKPGSMTYDTAGHGSGSDLSMALFAYLTGLKMVNVPFNGGAPQVGAAVAGQVNALFATIPSAQGFFKTGQLRPLGISTSKRDQTLPDVPTIAEAGVPNYEMGDWVGIVAPAKTPQDVIDKLNAAINKALVVPDVRVKIEKIGTQIAGGAPKEFRDYIASELAKWNKVVTAMDLQIK